ncbi:MAG: type II toxin-antitoxin system RelB/DinJ family antitoxin [Gammaproteobacteria bacterium]|nr:type II toxin-antitoxin system RelB/DinJ family antitoxin [Gammaproteobacteria bacterium]
MYKAATVNARIEPMIKKRAEAILDAVGLSSAEAIRLFYNQICLHQGIPFEIKIPNKTTIKAMQAADKGKVSRVENIDNLFE